MLLYAALLLEERAPTLAAAPATLLASTIANVALWDPELAELLTAASPEDMLRPQRILKTLADDRGWTPQVHPGWENGTMDDVSGRPQTHSALLALADPGGILHARLWSAQVSVLLPAVEERRLSLVRRLRHELRTPVHTGYGVVTDPTDLEIGQIAFQLRGRALPAAVYRQVQTLLRVRNALAHGDPVSPAEALSPDLYRDV